jgi:hypothetical protein
MYQSFYIFGIKGVQCPPIHRLYFVSMYMYVSREFINLFVLRVIVQPFYFASAAV